MQQQSIASIKQTIKINLFKNTNQQNKTFIIMNKLTKNRNTVRVGIMHVNASTNTFRRTVYSVYS